jgi:hypothetical protein
MTGFREDRLQQDRRNLRRALNDLEAGLIAGVPDADRDTVRDLLIQRIDEIDRQLDTWLIKPTRPDCRDIPFRR